MIDLDLFLKVTGQFSVISPTLIVIIITSDIFDPGSSNFIQICTPIWPFRITSLIDLDLLFKVTGQFPWVLPTQLVINITPNIFDPG
jgi:hypothetical protein